MVTNLYSLPSRNLRSDTAKTQQTSVELHLPPRIAELTAEGDRKNLAELHTYHQKTEGLVEALNTYGAAILVKAREAEQAEARWQHVGNLGTRWTPFHWVTVMVVVLLLVLAETVLTATVMAGLDLPDIERWLIALGVTLAATVFGIKGGAYGWRAIADDERDHIPVTPKDRNAARINVAMVLMILAGQFMARESYALQSDPSDSAGVSSLVAGGLTLLQAGLYGMVGYFFYRFLPHLRTQAAYVQHRACRKELHQLQSARAKAAAQLNRATMQLRATWAANIALTKSLVYEYLAELDRTSDKAPATFIFDERVMKPIPSWVCALVEPQPSHVQNWTESGPSSSEEMARSALQRDRMLLGTTYRETQRIGQVGSTRDEEVPQTRLGAGNVATNSRPDYDDTAIPGPAMHRNRIGS